MTTNKINLPVVAGFYWAKWRIAAEGTRDGDAGTLSGEWEVVQVYENHIDSAHPCHFMVMVAGVEMPQSLENFFWGDWPVPLLREAAQVQAEYKMPLAVDRVQICPPRPQYMRIKMIGTSLGLGPDEEARVR